MKLSQPITEETQVNGRWDIPSAVTLIHDWGVRHLGPSPESGMSFSQCGDFVSFEEKACEKEVVSLTNSSDRRKALDNMTEFFAKNLGLSSDKSAEIRVVTDELLTNAFFDAGHEKEGGSSRKEEVILPAGKEIRLFYGADADWYCVGVRDPYGRLEHEMMARALMRGLKVAAPREGQGGAGLGIFTIFSLVQSLRIKVIKGQSTEIQCLFSREKRNKKIMEMAIDYHFWCEGVK